MLAVQLDDGRLHFPTTSSPKLPKIWQLLILSAPERQAIYSTETKPIKEMCRI